MCPIHRPSHLDTPNVVSVSVNRIYLITISDRIHNPNISFHESQDQITISYQIHNPQYIISRTSRSDHRNNPNTINPHQYYTLQFQIQIQNQSGNVVAS